MCCSQVEEILSGAHSQGVDAGVIAEEGVLRAYRAASGQAAADGGAAAAGSSVDARKPVEGDCPICFNELQVGPGRHVVCCGTCTPTRAGAAVRRCQYAAVVLVAGLVLAGWVAAHCAHSLHHSCRYPASSSSCRTTSVGKSVILRVCSPLFSHDVSNSQAEGDMQGIAV
jgi:hypothetical protein